MDGSWCKFPRVSEFHVDICDDSVFFMIIIIIINIITYYLVFIIYYYHYCWYYHSFFQYVQNTDWQKQMCQTRVFVNALIWEKTCGRCPFRNWWYEAPWLKMIRPWRLLICKFDEFGASKMAKFGASDHVYFDDCEGGSLFSLKTFQKLRENMLRYWEELLLFRT